jgi:hypothetical protein
VGPRVEEPALMLINPYPWSAPLEEVKLKMNWSAGSFTSRWGSAYLTGVERGAPFSPIRTTTTLAGSVLLAFFASCTALAGLWKLCLTSSHPIRARS